MLIRSNQIHQFEIEKSEKGIKDILFFMISQDLSWNQGDTWQLHLRDKVSENWPNEYTFQIETTSWSSHKKKQYREVCYSLHSQIIVAVDF
jgi:hypothetical protein